MGIAVPIVMGAIMVAEAAAQGVSQGMAGSAQAAQDEQNQKLAQYTAATTLQQGAQEAGKATAAGSQAISGQRAAAAASGMDVSSGSVGQLEEGTREASTLDALTIENNAARQAWGYKAQGNQFANQAQLQKSQIGWGVGASILGGASRAAGTIYDYTRTSGQSIGGSRS